MRIAFVLLLVSFAGCLSATNDSPTPVEGCPAAPLDAEGIRLVQPDHDPIAGIIGTDMWDFETTNVRTCSLPAIGWTPLRDNGVPHKYLGEIDMRGDLDLGAVAVLGNGEDPMVYILDIANRAEPQVLSTINLDGDYVVDVKISDDGALLFTASQTVPGPGELTGLTNPSAPNGFTVFNIEDPANPTFVGTFESVQDLGCHMLNHEIIQGTDVLACVSQQIRLFRLDRVGNDVVLSTFMDYFPEENGIPTPSDPLVPVPGVTSGPHDMTISVDSDGRNIMVVSHWNSGVRVVDLTEAPVIDELGAWKGEGAAYYDGNVHTAMLVEVGTERFIVATPEMTYAGVIPAIWVLDASDYSDLRLVAEWTHPGQYTSDGNGTGPALLMTTHQWQVAPTGPDVAVDDVRIYMTFNHAGLWVLDFGQILAGNNQEAILGYNLARTPLDQEGAVGNAILSTWDVNVVDGYIYGSDRATGLWVFHYTEDTLGDARLTGYA